MAEGVALAGAVAPPVFDDPDRPPPPEQCAALGWDKGPRWDRFGKRWVASKRARGLYARREPDDRPADGGPDADSTPGDGARPGAEDGQADRVQDADRDGTPGWMRPATQPIPRFQVDDGVRADVKALIALAYTIPGEALPLIDPYCFGPLAEPGTSNAVIESVSDIVCGSPRVAQWVASATGLMPWIKLGFALKPVAVNVFRHHVARTVEVEVDREARSFTVAPRSYEEYPAA